jgi:hypothetical protein
VAGGGYNWTNREFGPPSANWEALEIVAKLCETYAPRRCVLYASPINPFLRERLSEPGLYEDYLATLRIVAGRHGLIFRDYTDALKRNDFRIPKLGIRDPVHMNEVGRERLATLLQEPLGLAIANVNASVAAASGGAGRP